MKKSLSGILALCLVVGLVACAKPADKNPTEPTATKTTTQINPIVPTESVAPTASPTEIATAEAPEFATDPANGETDVIASEVTEAPTKETQLICSLPTGKPTILPTTTPTAKPTASKVAEAPTKETQLTGSTPTKKPIPIVTAATKPTTQPAATKPTTSPTGTLPAGQFVYVPDLPDYDTFASTGTSHYGNVADAQIKVGKVTQEIAPNDPRLIRLLNYVGPATQDRSISVVRQGLVEADEIHDIDRTAPSVLKIKLSNHEKFSELWIYGDTFLGIRQAKSAKDIRADQICPYMCLARNAGWELPSNQFDPTRDIWIDFLLFAGFGPEISAAPTAPTEPAPTIGTVAPGSLKGKSITIYGLGVQDPQVDYGNYYDKAYKRMMRTAADEWAAMNGVTIRYMGSYNQNTVIASYSGAGDACDLIIPTDNLGLLLEIGLASPFTEAEYNTLATLVGDNRYLDVLGRKDQSYGMVLPWAGNMMVYFNQSMFAKYKVKSPLEYYNEGAWTWENFAKCMNEITRDTDGDGTTDIYGLPGDSWVNLVNPEKRDTFTGKLLNTIDDPWIQDFMEMKYNAYKVAGSSKNGENNIETNAAFPMYAMQISPCETYDPQDVYKFIANGDALVAVPLPRWEGENGESKEWVKLTQMSAHIFAGTEEREATFDLLCYLTKCGMKYMADCSLGAISCDYAGIQGNTDASKKWKDTYTADIQQRKVNLEKQKNYDPTYISKIAKALNQDNEWYTYTPYNSYYNTYLDFLNCVDIYEKPPAESVPIIKNQYSDALTKYNKAYYSKY